MAEKGQNEHRLLLELQGLYEVDPVRFEALSRELIRQTIESFPPDQQHRAWGLQFRLDAILSRYRHPVARMNKMVELLWQQFAVFQRALTEPGRLAAERTSRPPADVIPFPTRDKPHNHH